jgi:hypothetical protein
VSNLRAAFGGGSGNAGSDGSLLVPPPPAADHADSAAAAAAPRHYQQLGTGSSLTMLRLEDLQVRAHTLRGRGAVCDPSVCACAEGAQPRSWCGHRCRVREDECGVLLLAYRNPIPRSLLYH